MNLSRRQYTSLDAAGLFCGALFLFTVGLGGQEIIGFEARFYLFALEMWRHGVSLFPTTYGTYYPDYPVTATLIIYGAAKLFGGLSKFVAVLPTATAAAVTLTVTYLIGALHARSFAWIAALLMLMTNTFVMEARTISPDQYIAMVTALSFYLLYSASMLGKKPRWRWLPLLFTFGFFIRGPIGLVVPAGTACVFYLAQKNLKLFFLMGVMALITLCVCSAVLFAMAYHAGGMPFVFDVLRMQVLGRMQDASLPWYFYFTESLGAYALTYPLALLVALGVVQRYGAERKLMLVLMGWALVILIGLSIPAGKKIRYILAIVPALSLLAAFIFSGSTKQWYLQLLRKGLRILFLFLPALCFTGTCVLYYAARRRGFILDISYFNIKNIFIILAGFGFLIRKNDVLIIGVAALTFMAAYILVVEPINLTINKTRHFVVEMETLRHQKHAALVFYHQNPDALPIKYIVDMPRDEKPLFIATPEALQRFNENAFFITPPEWFAQLTPARRASFKVIYLGQVGHDNVLVFVRR
jgi:4-amino-4-deoxy-L-arabinose transferase-like glycosyltransferase